MGENRNDGAPVAGGGAAAASTFRRQRVEALGPVITRVALAQMQRWHGGADGTLSLNIRREMAHLTLNIRPRRRRGQGFHTMLAGEHFDLGPVILRLLFSIGNVGGLADRIATDVPSSISLDQAVAASQRPSGYKGRAFRERAALSCGWRRSSGW